eukprot:CAMPEP_0185777964 /NCGR_PEP_ID=MMETSP1174-20130828/91268_1 /TAXON_ID=35687 /ORGANISM="Dictyocha speculum, Strain CCMP1381" /LENGTH=508 /DNA_ID=CAMNT_0028466539 /DNA_START=20 /DNA_END=1546 /DNA_ORIENTATION=+
MSTHQDKRQRVSGSADVDESKLKATLRLAMSVAAEKVIPGGLVGGIPICEEELGWIYNRPDSCLVSEEDLGNLRRELESLISSDVSVEIGTETYPDAQAKLASQKLALSLLASRIPLGGVGVVRVGDVTRLAPYDYGKLCNTFGPLRHAGYRIQGDGTGGVRLTWGDVSVCADKATTTAAILETRKWGVGRGVVSLGDLNGLKEVGRERKEFMLAAEYRQEARLRDIVRRVEASSGATRCICIAGPTSSGKTTFAAKLCTFLGNEGLSAHGLTVDHYYLPLDRQPRYLIRQQRSDCDYDHIESMDVDLVNQHISDLINGKTIEPPVYNMKTGMRDPPKRTFSIPPNGILVIEGIHALNPQYTEKLPQEQVFKIFLSPQTAIQVDDFNVIKSTDVRLLRRMSRDYLFRAHSASRTLDMWENVRRGEGKWIFPFQGQAHVVMNSAHEYDLSVLKPLLEPLLRSVPPTDANFVKAQELARLLDLVAGWGERDVPATSLLREFLGNGAYDEH